MKIILSFWKTILCASTIVFLSLMSGSKIPTVQIPHIDKLVHFIMYFSFGLVLIHDGLHFSKIHLSHLKLIFISIIVVIGWGAALEVLQRIPGLHRSSDFFDFLANTAGAVVAAIFYKFFEPLLNRINALIIKQ
jgi:VanZ family protein